MRLLMENWRKFNEQEERSDYAKILEIFRSNGVQAVELGEMVLTGPDVTPGIHTQQKNMKEIVRLVKELLSIGPRDEQKQPHMKDSEAIAQENLERQVLKAMQEWMSWLTADQIRDARGFERKFTKALISSRIVTMYGPQGLAAIAQRKGMKTESFFEDYEWMKEWAGA